MSLYDDLLNKEAKLSLIGLGYVGLPIAVAFSKKVDVIGYDLNAKKISTYQEGRDPTKEVGDEGVQASSVCFTSNPEKLQEARFHIVAVPTPITRDKIPDLEPLKSASRTLGENLCKGSIVVYERTV